MRPTTTTLIRVAGVFAGYGLLAALVSAPVAAERAVEAAEFRDRVGTVPVEVSLTRNGMSTLDTGILGRLYWEETGVGGLGAYVRVTGTPEAGGSLSSYVSPRFVRTNAAFVNDPDEVARAYGEALSADFWRRFLLSELAVLLVGGIVLTAVSRGRPPWTPGMRRRNVIGLGVVGFVVAAGLSTGTAAWLLARWDGTAEVTQRYPMPGVDGLSFSSPEALEIARQIQPFIEKNNSRIKARTERYQEAVADSFPAELDEHSADLAPAEGERIVIAEADPQGSIVATSVRREIYRQLVDALGAEALALRTISGDVTSNGTVAESGFVEDEATASGAVPVVAVKGDHDTDTTVEQLTENGVVNPDFDLTNVAGLEVIVGNDPAFKTLFGGLSINESGVTETQLGENLREEVGDAEQALILLVHQPASAAGYLGIPSISELDSALGRETTPFDDGIPDLPPGIINIGHLHDFSPPRVIWNTDGDEVTWTVVNQLGTSGGVEEHPTFNRFSTPFSVPLKTVSIQLQYVDGETGLQTGYANIDISTAGVVTIGDRVDLGLPPE